MRRLLILSRLLTALAVATTGLVVSPSVAHAAVLLPVEVGARPNATRLDFPLGDRLQASVDVGTGNLQLSSVELTMPGIGGDLQLGVTHNSLLLGPGSPVTSSAAGRAWQMRFGQDTKLVANDDGSMLYLAPEGLQGRYQPTSPGASSYVSPAGFKDTLVKTGTTGWTLTGHASNTVSTFNATGRLTQVADRNGQVTTLEYAATGGQNLLKITTTRGTANQRKVNFNFAGGYLQSITQTGSDGTTRTATYTYFASTPDRLQSITDMAGRVTSFTYGTGSRVASVTTPGSKVTNFVYDSAFRLTQVTRVGAGGVNSVTRLTYPSATSTLVAGPNTSTGTPVASGPRTAYTINATKRVTQAVDPLGRTRAASYTPLLDLASTTSGGGGQSTASYGANSGESLTSVTGATGADATLDYNNTGASQFLPSGGSDAQGNAALGTYDGAGNPLSSANTGAGTQASVTYNANGTLATSTDPGGPVTTYTQDPATAQITTITPPTGSGLGAQTFTYDTFARLGSVTDGRGIVATYSYDKLDRLLSIDYSGPTPTVSYTYHPAGTVKTRVDASGTVTYGYDLLDRLTSRTATAGGGTITYGYDKAGNVTAATDAGGTIAYTYDAAYQLTSQTVTGGDTVAYAYNLDGKRTDTWFATNTARTIFAAHTHTDFDQAGRIARTWTSRASADATRVFDTSYCHSPYIAGQACPTTTSTADTGLVQYSTDNLTAARSIHSYDAANRLTGVTNWGGQTYGYGYDVRGNRTSVTVDGVTTQTRTYNAGNQITSTGYAYDQAGNRTADPAVGTLSYNGAGQMTAKDATVDTTYTYAGSDQSELVARDDAGFNYDFTYGRTDNNGLPLLETMTKNTSSYQFDYDQTGSPISLRVASGNRNFFVLDGQGTIVGLVKQDGTVSGTYTYDPYGNPINVTGTGEAVNVNVTRHTLGFADPHDGTGYTKHGVRWNDTTTGTWTTHDPLTRLIDPNNGNRYNYAASNPVNYIDPTGEDKIDCALSAIGTIGGAFLTAVSAVSTPVTTLGGAALAGLGVTLTAASYVGVLRSC